MMSLIQKIHEDLTEALKARDEVKVSTLRLLISSIGNAKIAKGSELVDDEVLAEISKDTKRHQESIAAYKDAGRDELFQKEEQELAVLKAYLAPEVSDEELESLVDNVIKELGASNVSDMGNVIKEVRARGGVGIDGAKVAQMVRGKLAS